MFFLVVSCYCIGWLNPIVYFAFLFFTLLGWLTKYLTQLPYAIGKMFT